MMENVIKNICLIGFALIGPVTLPAGGIQRNLDDYNIFDNSTQIVLNESCSLYSYPRIKAKKLMVLQYGSSLTVLRKWVANEKDIWVRVELATNPFIEKPHKTSKGWIKI